MWKDSWNLKINNILNKFLGRFNSIIITDQLNKDS